MDISISDELWDRIQWKLDTDFYPSVDAVVERALEFLDEYDVAEVRDMVMEGVEDLRSGRYKEYTNETRDELLQDIKVRARELRQSVSKTTPSDRQLPFSWRGGQ